MKISGAVIEDRKTMELEAVLRYVYPGVTPRNGRVVAVCSGGNNDGDRGSGDGGSTAQTLSGAQVAELVAQDGVDLARWSIRYYHRLHEGWVRMLPDTQVAFAPPDQMRLELALEPVLRASTDGDEDGGEDGGDAGVDAKDGFYGIGIYGGKTEANQGASPKPRLPFYTHYPISPISAAPLDPPGTLWRSAWQLGAAFTFSVGARFTKTSADTTKTWTTLPAYTFKDWGVFAAAQPFCAAWVAVEMGGTPLAEFDHPDRAVYVLGSEDNGLPSVVLRACAHHISLPAAQGRTASFNVAATGSIIMYDRLTKRRRERAAAESKRAGRGRPGLDVAAARVEAGAAAGAGGGGGGSELRQSDSLPRGRPGVDSAKPSQVSGRGNRDSKGEKGTLQGFS